MLKEREQAYPTRMKKKEDFPPPKQGSRNGESRSRPLSLRGLKYDHFQSVLERLYSVVVMSTNTEELGFSAQTLALPLSNCVTLENELTTLY